MVVVGGPEGEDDNLTGKISRKNGWRGSVWEWGRGSFAIKGVSKKQSWRGV